MARPEYKILKNMPYHNAYGQYFYDDGNQENFWDVSGTITPFSSDDLYTIITEEGYDSGGDNQMPDWRPISNVFIGNAADIDNSQNVFIQKYYEFGSFNYLKTSAPNVVFLSFDLVENNNAFNLTPITNPYSDGSGLIGVRILNWDWKEGDSEYPSDFISGFSTIDANYFELGTTNTTDTYLSHQYNSSGLKTIKASVFSKEYATGKMRYKNIDIKLFLGLDGVFVEDFVDLGGPDFTYLPWPETSPIIGGISNDSDYYKSIKSIVDSNQFEESEKFERYFADKALNNNELGDSIGDSDIEQVRVFKAGTYDMNYLLGIDGEITNVAGTYFNANYEIGEGQYWDGETNTFPDDNSVGKLFIDESEDSFLINDILFELNCGDVNISSLIDTSGNGNKGILIGDYKVTKDSKGIKSRRDTVIKIPKPDDKNGAF